MRLINRYPRKETKRLKRKEDMLAERLKGIIEKDPDIWTPLLSGHSKFLETEGEKVSRWWISTEREKYVSLSKWLVELGFLVLSLAYPLVLLLWSRSPLTEKPTWFANLLFLGFAFTLISLVAGLSYCLYFSKSRVVSDRIFTELLTEKAEEYKSHLKQEVATGVLAEKLDQEVNQDELWDGLIDDVYDLTLDKALASLHGEAVRTHEAFNIVFWQIGLFGLGSIVLFVALAVAFFLGVS